MHDHKDLTLDLRRDLHDLIVDPLQDQIEDHQDRPFQDLLQGQEAVVVSQEEAVLQDHLVVAEAAVVVEAVVEEDKLSS